ncbi:MAG: AzlD domain-containing protein [Peptococcaceae bacterium]|nr:AzlD domain-containing protein [Peptococcaceae bacterium]
MEQVYNYGYVLAAVGVMALVTYIPRMIPLTFMRRKITSRFVRSFLYYMPYAVLTAMTLPAILYSTSGMASALVGMVVAVILAYRDKGLLIVALGAVAAVFVTERLLLFL